MSSSSSAVYKKIEKIEKMLSNLKLVLEKKDALVKSKKSKKSESVKPKSKSKPESISKCKSKTDLEKFTIKELKVWIKENKIDTKKLSEKHKADFIKLVWDNIMNSRIVESECDSSDNSSDSDSDSSDSDSDSSSGSKSDSD